MSGGVLSARPSTSNLEPSSTTTETSTVLSFTTPNGSPEEIFLTGNSQLDHLLDTHNISHSLRRRASFNYMQLPDIQRKISHVALEVQAMDDILELLGLISRDDRHVREFPRRMRKVGQWTWETVCTSLNWSSATFRNLAQCFRWAGYAARTQTWRTSPDLIRTSLRSSRLTLFRFYIFSRQTRTKWSS